MSASAHTTEVYLITSHRGIKPATAYDAELIAAYPLHQQLRATLHKARSVPQHRLFFAVVSHVAKACGLPTEDLLDIIKLETGHYRVIERRGERWRVPSSIAFNRMDAAQFRDFFDRALGVIAEETGIRQPQLLVELQAMFPELFG